jgi:hypothetical protein
MNERTVGKTIRGAILLSLASGEQTEAYIFSDIGRHHGASIVVINGVIAELIAEGLVAETTIDASRIDFGMVDSLRLAA